MLYAKIVLGLPVEGPFDYIVPPNLHTKIKVGVRAWVNFRNKKMLGYVVGLAKKTNIQNLKSILELIDESPILDRNMLSLAKELSNYYCCSWGEAIETTLPEGLRKGKRLPDSDTFQGQSPKSGDSPCGRSNSGVTLIHDLDGRARWDIYIQEIKDTLGKNKSVIILLPDINSLIKTKEIISTKIDCSLSILYRKQRQELEEWARIKNDKVNVVIGSRSGIFAPLNNLGLIIIEEEQDSVYKQDQIPHYHAREVAFMRINIDKAKLILGSNCPSLESFYLAKKPKINTSTTLPSLRPSLRSGLKDDSERSEESRSGLSKDTETKSKCRIDGERKRTIKYIFIPPKKDFPEIKIINTGSFLPINRRKHAILSKYLEDSIISALNSKGKILLFLNRKGFATFASCRYCGLVLKCPRCNINLVYHFQDNILNCHYCNFKMPPPNICPDCNSGYIRYSGTGTEKIESELARIFPQARIQRLDDPKGVDTKEADIFVSTSSVIKQTDYHFDLIGILSIDNSLNRIDLRASEKTFVLLVGLLALTQKTVIIQTHLPHHHCFQALEKKDINIFYEEELKQRKQLNFPPYKHIGLVKLRGRQETRVKDVSNDLFSRLNKYNKNRTIKIVSVNPSQPAKLRNKFYWQILTCSGIARKISKFLKFHLKNFSHSGIIVTVDIDPL